jgi:hypothetical protein
LKNKYDGETIHIDYKNYSNPVFSPEHNFFISYNMDLSLGNPFQDGYVYNGLALYEIRNKRIIEIFTSDLTWGPEDVCWKDNNTIYIEQICFDYDKEKRTQRFKKLIIE